MRATHIHIRPKNSSSMTCMAYRRREGRYVRAHRDLGSHFISCYTSLLCRFASLQNILPIPRSHELLSNPQGRNTCGCKLWNRYCYGNCWRKQIANKFQRWVVAWVASLRQIHREVVQEIIKSITISAYLTSKTQAANKDAAEKKG